MNKDPQRTGKNAATLVALLGLILLGLCLVGLVALVTPAALGIVIVVFGFFLVGAFHCKVPAFGLRKNPKYLLASLISKSSHWGTCLESQALIEP